MVGIRKLETIQSLEELALKHQTMVALRRAGVTVEELITEVRCIGADRLTRHPGIGKARAKEIMRVIDEAGFILHESQQSRRVRELLTAVNPYVLMDCYEDLESMAPKALEAVDRLIHEVLDEEELRVIELRFGLTGRRPSSIDECANILGVTVGRIRRLESKALVKLGRLDNLSRLKVATCYSQKALRSRVLQLQSDIDKLQQELDVLKGNSPYPDFMLGGMPIDELGPSVRTYNCLMRAGIRTVGELCEYTEDDLLRIRNFSAKSVEEVHCLLRGVGLSLAT